MPIAITTASSPPSMIQRLVGIYDLSLRSFAAIPMQATHRIMPVTAARNENGRPLSVWPTTRAPNMRLATSPIFSEISSLCSLSNPTIVYPCDRLRFMRTSHVVGIVRYVLSTDDAR